MRNRVTFLARALLDLELIVLVAALALTIALPRLLLPAIVLALLFWPLRLLAAEQWWRATPVDWALLPLLVALPLSLWASADWSLSLPHVYRLVLGVLALYAAAHWLTSAQRARLLVLLLSGLGAGLALLTPLVVGPNAGQLSAPLAAITSRLPALVTDTVNANIMAGTLLLLFPLPAALLLVDNRATAWPVKLGYALAAIATGGMLLLLASRGALLGLAVVLITLLCVRWRTLVWAVPPLALVTIAAVLLLNPSTALDALMGGSGINSLSGRVEIWSRALYVLGSFPLSGTGMGLFGPVTDTFYPFFLAGPGEIFHAHNLLLQVALDLGIFGLVGWLAALGVVLMLAWRLGTGRVHTAPVWVALGGGVLAGMLGMLTHGLLDAALWSARAAALMWLVWGVALAGWLNAPRIDRVSPSVDKEKPEPHHT